eukprot:888624-Rhodomonas_salina.1
MCGCPSVQAASALIAAVRAPYHHHTLPQYRPSRSRPVPPYPPSVPAISQQTCTTIPRLSTAQLAAST